MWRKDEGRRSSFAPVGFPRGDPRVAERANRRGRLEVAGMYPRGGTIATSESASSVLLGAFPRRSRTVFSHGAASEASSPEGFPDKSGGCLCLVGFFSPPPLNLDCEMFRRLFLNFPHFRMSPHWGIDCIICRRRGRRYGFHWCWWRLTKVGVQSVLEAR